jgi:membrane protein insertase Oxa1/YidC/SpoIIIJ
MSRSAGAGHMMALRCFSVSAGNGAPTDAAATSTDIIIPHAAGAPIPGQDVVQDVMLADPTAALGNYPYELVMKLMEHTHVALGIPYWEAILVLTVALRVLLLPISVKSVINGARMAVLKPHMHKLQQAMLLDPNSKTDRNTQLMYQTEMRGM